MQAQGSRWKAEMTSERGRGWHRHLQQAFTAGARGSSPVARRDHHAGTRKWAAPAAAGTHRSPTGECRKFIPTRKRYYTIVEDMKTVARGNLIFGLHVHIGVEDREVAIHLMNAARYFVPHLLALSANSPFWLGMDMGLKSYRCKVPSTNFRAPTSPIISPVGANIRASSTCWSAPTASTTRRKSGGISARIRRSRRWSSGAAIFR